MKLKEINRNTKNQQELKKVETGFEKILAWNTNSIMNQQETKFRQAKISNSL